ncbi:thioredoxin domain-containing protein 11 [Coccinella septempunctata]|uniref:thioredoxin domain-containing protein 11 n=1 Tax=Coccinella septempunctata TaxID=41139 RepID=UPI001D07A4A8|nr:thioredoxin domain-containing protein 11 [Coccinella septempunctata]
MSSADSQPYLEDTSSTDDHENDLDKEKKTRNISKTEQKGEVKEKLKNKYINKMLYVMKEFLIMVVVAIAYAAITNEPPKIGKSPAAYRFFSDNPYVTDWYRGEMSDAIMQARSNDISFVMFYAPWDSESQHARKEFQIAARYMQQEVTFVAVNCWQPGSECRTQNSKVQKWPVLIAYPTHGRGIQYNGPLIAVHMMAFLKRLISPFTNIESTVIRHQILPQYDAIVWGNVNAAPSSRDFIVFYQIALRLLETYPLQDIGVTIEPQSSYPPQIRIYNWNETLIYPESEWEVEPIFNWIMKNVQYATRWISPSGSKSMSLSHYLQPGPALILFTPRNPIVIHNDFYSMLKEIAYDYNFCGDNFNIKSAEFALKWYRRDKYLQQLKLIEGCRLKKFKIKRITSTKLWSNTTVCFENKYDTENVQQNEDSMIDYYGSMKHLCAHFLKDLDRDQNESIEHNTAKIGNILYKTSKWSDVSDYRSPENLRNYLSRETCRLFQIAQDYQPLHFSKELYDYVEGFNITGFKCNTNKTLNFIAMDSLYYHHYAEKLGVDLFQRPNKTALVILDDKMESHYIMSDDITETNVKKFIYNYSRGSLKRALSSLATVKSENTHSYPKNRLCSYEDAKFCVRELSAINFLETISQTNKAVIIFYYSKQCSFCNGISYRFLTVAKYWSSMEELLFARVDGDLNLLPWEYTMEIYPTILIIPANQGSESRVFPMDMPITLENLIGFILTNLQPCLKLEAMWTLCHKAKFNPDIVECISSLRLQISQVIEKSLQEWRTSNQDGKAQLSLKLQHLHNLYTLFLEYPYNATLAENIFDRLKLIELKPLETTV